jgi:uncharacterized protein Usg
MLERRAVSKDFRKQVLGYGLTTARRVVPDSPSATCLRHTGDVAS